MNMSEMSLSEILDAGARGEILAGAGMLAVPALASEDAQRALIRALFGESRFQARTATFAKNARKAVVHVVVGRRDREVLALLERIADDVDHPLRTEAIEELLATRDRAILAPRYARWVPAILDGHPFGGYTHQLALAATYAMGAEAVTRELVPRYLTESAIASDPAGVSRASSVMFELIHQIGAKAVEANHPGLVSSVLALESSKPLKKPWTKLLAALDASVVARARAGTGGAAPAEPTPAAPGPKAKKKAGASAAKGGSTGRGFLARYEAGEHRAVWAELRALGEKVYDAPLDAEARAVADATMKAFVANVGTIAAVLKKAKYTLAEKKAVRPPRRDVAKLLDALAKIAGPLPIALVAFYETCDGVTLAQDVEAPVDDSPLFGPGLLDELGRSDPLMVAPLATMVEDAKAQRARGTPVRLYVAPDPACKGTIDDEIADENPVRATASGGFDAELGGGGEGYFVEWLRGFVEAGGFHGPLGDDDRAKLMAALRPF
jgi:hypothetical protein